VTRARVAILVVAIGLVAAVALVRRGSPPRPPAEPSPAAPTTGDSSPSGPVAWSPTGAAPAAATAADPTTAPTWPGSTTATTTAPLSPAGVATAVTAAYLTSVPGPARRGACRPFADAALDATLAAPSWSGATASVAPPGSVTIRPADVVAADITSTAIGYELVATPNGGGAPVAVQVRILKQPDGRWLADSVSVS
jgi:hypothetical protein